MSLSTPDKISYKRDIHWVSVVLNLQVFISTLIGVHFIIYEAYFLTTLFNIALIILALLGVTAGAHRLWAHQSYKATLSLRIFLMLCQTLAGPTCIYNWVRLHRLHHKYFQTDLDPFNPERGFFFSHVISHNLKLSPAQEKALEEIDVSDLENDGVVMFQKKYFWGIFIILGLLLPINAPIEYWGETVVISSFITGWLRLGFTYNLSLLIYSAINISDFQKLERKSYDSNAVFLINKSYWISYHYLCPWDYQTGEFGKYGDDCTSKFIRVCEALEFASDLRVASDNLIREALGMAVDEKKSFRECVDKLDKVLNKFPSEEYLLPWKYI